MLKFKTESISIMAQRRGTRWQNSVNAQEQT